MIREDCIQFLLNPPLYLGRRRFIPIFDSFLYQGSKILGSTIDTCRKRNIRQIINHPSITDGLVFYFLFKVTSFKTQMRILL